MEKPRTYSLEEIERALAQGLLKVLAPNGNFWSTRRNGATQTWKTRPGEYRIPLKAGFRSYGEITHKTIVGRPGDGHNVDFIINSMCKV
jgi:photosystem II stability/assembly factor-like uncharacterized protein